VFGGVPAVYHVQQACHWAIVQGGTDIICALRTIRGGVTASLHNLLIGDLLGMECGTMGLGLTSISPLAGHSPYTCDSGSIQMAGQSQSLQQVSTNTLHHLSPYAPLRQLCPHFHFPERDILLSSSIDSGTLHRIDHRPALTIAACSARRPIIGCAAIQRVVPPIENLVRTDLVGGESGNYIEIGVRRVEVIC
jgi:hypothetical protein